MFDVYHVVCWLCKGLFTKYVMPLGGGVWKNYFQWPGGRQGWEKEILFDGEGEIVIFLAKKESNCEPMMGPLLT